MVRLAISRKWRVAYRVLILLICVFAALECFEAAWVYGFNSFYFPREKHTSDYIDIYLWLVVSIVLLLEGIFLFVFRRFTRPI